MKKIQTLCRIFKPDIFFPAGGTYLISGKFHKLNRICFPTICKGFKNFIINK